MKGKKQVRSKRCSRCNKLKHPLQLLNPYMLCKECSDKEGEK